MTNQTYIETNATAPMEKGVLKTDVEVRDKFLFSVQLITDHKK